MNALVLECVRLTKDSIEVHAESKDSRDLS